MAGLLEEIACVEETVWWRHRSRVFQAEGVRGRLVHCVGGGGVSGRFCGVCLAQRSQARAGRDFILASALRWRDVDLKWKQRWI